MSTRSRNNGRRVLIFLIAVLTVGYVMTAQMMQHSMQARHLRNVENTAIPMSGGQVPDSIQNQVISRLGNVAKTDEIAFFPLDGNRVGVYATVDLGYTGDGLTRTDILTIQSDINSWFADVYQGQTENDVADAEIYFLKNGRTVGGAGLGVDAYRAMTTNVSATGGSSLVQSFKSGRQVAGESVKESWMQTES